MSKLEAFLTTLAWVGLIVSAAHLPLKYAAYRYHASSPTHQIRAIHRGFAYVFYWKRSTLTLIVSAAWLIAVYSQEPAVPAETEPFVVVHASEEQGQCCITCAGKEACGRKVESPCGSCEVFP
jgi:hypothetical protein